jgi:hypothetical protein
MYIEYRWQLNAKCINNINMKVQMTINANELKANDA